MSCGASVLLRELEQRGIALRVVDGQVRYRPVGALTGELAERLQGVPCDHLALELDARSDPLTAQVIDLFDGEIVPESEWGETVPFQAGGAS